MIIKEVSAREYSQLFPASAVAFNSVAFTELNALKADRIAYVLLSDDKGHPLLGITLGKQANQYVAPFSAPFACFDYNKKHGADTFVAAVRLLKDTFGALKITLPPSIYGSMRSEMPALAFLSAGAKIEYADWNYSFKLSESLDFESILDSPNRKKLRGAMKQGYRMEAAAPRRAYEVIRKNRQAKGYPLRMTLEQVLATIAPQGPVTAHCFVLVDALNRDVAASIIYDVAPGMAQVIYWGDDPDCDCRNPMIALAAFTVEHFARLGYSVLDIGPSSERGEPNFGLCSFKESIGCIVSPKFTFSIKNNN